MTHHKHSRQWSGRGLLLLAAALTIAPVLHLVTQTFAHTGGRAFLLVLENPAFSAACQSSAFVCLAALCGQLLVSIFGGWGLASCRFPGRSALLLLCGVLILLPTQTLLLPQYWMLRQLHLLDRLWALVLPLSFFPLGSLLLWHGFSAIPHEVIEAAQLAGAGPLMLLRRIALPLCRRELFMLILISAAEGWNLLEQPMAYLKAPERYPLSVYLSTEAISDPQQLLAACVLTLAPAAALLCLFAPALLRERRS